MRDLQSAVTLSVFAALSFIVMTGAFMWKPSPMGESDDYMLATVSLQSRFDLSVRPADLQKAVEDFPEFASYLKDEYQAGRMSKYVDKHGGRLPWYFGTYSALCIPAKMLLRILGLPQVYAFALTNVLLYIASMLVVFAFLKRPPLAKLLGVLLVGVNPVTFYVVWQSAEVFIFFCVVASMVFLANKNYRLSALFTSLAGTMNSTAMALGLGIIVLYGLEQWRMSRAEGVAFGRYLASKMRDHALFTLPFTIFLLPVAYYLAKCGVMNLQVDYGFASREGYGQRFLAYLFDPNFGMLPYYTFNFLLFMPLALHSAWRGKPEPVVWAISFFGIIAGYSVMHHINCSMSGIARYNVWSAPVMLMVIATFDYAGMGRWAAKMTIFAVGLGILLSAAVIHQYGFMFASRTSDIRLTPLARWFLEAFPSAYNPYPPIFVDRVGHIPGGYVYPGPVAYTDGDGFVLKALLSPENAEGFLGGLSMTDDVRREVDRSVARAAASKGPFYLTLKKAWHVQVSPQKWIESSVRAVSRGTVDMSSLAVRNDAKKDSSGITLGKGGLQFGPYIQLVPGTYRVTLKGENLEHLDCRATCNAGEKPLEVTGMEVGKARVSFLVRVEGTADLVEFVSVNTGEVPARIASMGIEGLM